MPSWDFSGGGVRGNGKSLNQDFSVFSPYCNESTKFYCFDQNTGYVNENIDIVNSILLIFNFNICFGFIINGTLSKFSELLSISICEFCSWVAYIHKLEYVTYFCHSY